MNHRSSLVYSTENGRICPECREKRSNCRCKQGRKTVGTKSSDGIVRVRRDRKGRKGKTVTLISGLGGDLTALARELKTLCGSGGSVVEGEILIQGDHRQRLQSLLEKKGILSSNPADRQLLSIYDKTHRLYRKSGARLPEHAPQLRLVAR